MLNQNKLRQLKQLINQFRKSPNSSGNIAITIAVLAADLGIADTAIKFGEHSCALKSNFVNLTNLATIYRDFGKLEEAFSLVDRLKSLIKSLEQLTAVSLIEASILYKYDRLDQCHSLLCKVIEQQAPESSVDARFARAQVELSWRNPDGLIEYFYRTGNPVHRIGIPRSLHRDDVYHYFSKRGGDLLITAEQGLGDFFYFVQFIKAIYDAKIFDRIFLEVDERIPTRLLDLPSDIKTLPWNPRANRNVGHRHVVGLGDLPLVSYLFGISTGFLDDADLLSSKASLSGFGQNSQKSCGLSWATANGRNRYSRNLNLESLIGCLQSVDVLKDADFKNLQYSTGFSDDSNDSKRFFGSDLFPIKETEIWLEAIQSCDLVVSNDSSTAIVSGFFGIPTFMISPCRSTWFVGTRPEHRHFRSITKITSVTPYASEFCKDKLREVMDFTIGTSHENEDDC